MTPKSVVCDRTSTATNLEWLSLHDSKKETQREERYQSEGQQRRSSVGELTIADFLLTPRGMMGAPDIRKQGRHCLFSSLVDYLFQAVQLGSAYA